MNDVFSTLAVVGILAIWLWFAFFWAVMHMDIGITKSWWIGQSIILATAGIAIYAIIRWAVTT